MSDERPSKPPDTEALAVAEQKVKISVDSLAPPSKADLRLYGFVRGVLVGIAKAWFRLEVHGRDNVPVGQPYVLAPVHRSNIDFMLALPTERRRMRYLAKDTLWKGSWGKLFTALGGIPVHRGSADRDALKSCIAVIDNGEPLVMFPEGARQSGPEVQPLFDGTAYVQSRTGVPIVPVGIGGSEAAMPKGAKFIKPRKVVLVIGEPLPAPARGESGRVPRHAVRDQTDLLHRSLQAVFDEAQRLAGTPNAH